MEAEAMAAGCPGMFAHPGTLRAGSRRLEATRVNLGWIALDLGLLH